MDIIWHRSMEKHLNLMRNMHKHSYTSLHSCERCKSLTDSPKQAKINEKGIWTASTSHQTP